MKARNILVLIGSIIFFTGCSGDMSTMNEISEQLKIANSSSDEVTGIEKLVSYSKDKDLPLNVEIFNSNMQIPVQDLTDNLGQTLTVKIKIGDRNTITWEPKNNENIYLLFRE